MDHFVAFWNLENLFAPEGHPTRQPWLERAIRGDLDGWTEELFQRKLAQLARIIVQMNDGRGPDILGVCEVENRFVLDSLVAALTAAGAARAYAVVHADSERDRRGIDTAFLHAADRYDVDPLTVFSHFVLRRTGTRDILQATFRTKTTGRDLVIMCNHWPSRSGGAEASAGFRATAGETVSYWHERIREELGPTTAILAVGDFNDDPFDPSLRFNARAWRERGDVERTESAKFYNLAWRYLEQQVIDHRGNARTIDGTLYYRGDGNVFDQILASRALLDGRGPWCLREDTARIEAFSEMVSHRVGEGPIRFGLPKGDAATNVDEDGFSDHFPVSVVIAEATAAATLKR
ncbi:MAG: endonuclease/exonuclease/phosphatase family protein [Pseudomonadota bacterium]